VLVRDLLDVQPQQLHNTGVPGGQGWVPGGRGVEGTRGGWRGTVQGPPGRLLSSCQQCWCRGKLLLLLLHGRADRLRHGMSVAAVQLHGGVILWWLQGGLQSSCI
jgi:hypothetical protein